jgi:putative transposase
MFFKFRVNGVVETRAIYNRLGVDIEGKKDVLGLYTAENEGAKFCLSVLIDLKTRGVEDILIACIYGLKGFLTWETIIITQFAYKITKQLQFKPLY